MASTHDTNLSRYIFIFIAAYIGITVVIILVAYFTGSTSLAGTKLIAPMLCGIFVNDSFLKRNKRLYTSREKKKLIWGGLFAVLLIELFLSAITIYSGVYSDVSLSIQTLIYITLGTLLFILVLNYGLLLWVFGKMARKTLKGIEKKYGSISDVFE